MYEALGLIPNKKKERKIIKSRIQLEINLKSRYWGSNTWGTLYA